MKEAIVIAGSGQMALSIGDYFLEKGYPVTWVTENKLQQEVVLKKIANARKRQQKYFPENNLVYQADCLLLGQENISIADIIIESTSELLLKKKRMVSCLAEQMGDEVILFSNSSSFLPQSIHPRCIGAHFFYPVSLTACVELILNEDYHKSPTEKALRFLREAELVTIMEDQASPFLANRLLLALQSSCFQALLKGYTPHQVDNASRSKLLSMGQLTMMDTIGLDILFHAIKQYKSFETFGTVDFNLMETCLAELLKLGKMGKKNRDGLLMGSQLPWPHKIQDVERVDALNNELQDTFRLSCKLAYNRGNIGYDQLRSICEQIFLCENFSDLFRV